MPDRWTLYICPIDGHTVSLEPRKCPCERECAPIEVCPISELEEAQEQKMLEACDECTDRADALEKEIEANHALRRGVAAELRAVNRDAWFSGIAKKLADRLEPTAESVPFHKEQGKPWTRQTRSRPGNG